jgi:hypothetical protein
MPLSQMQTMYILGRMLEWRADGIWDSTANGLRELAAPLPPDVRGQLMVAPPPGQMGRL